MGGTILQAFRVRGRENGGGGRDLIVGGGGRDLIVGHGHARARPHPSTTFPAGAPAAATRYHAGTTGI